MAVTYVDSTMPGAISLYGVNGRFITWADKHIVTDAGYSKPYSSANAGIYLPPGSLGPGFKINHDSAVSGGAQRVVFRGFESASGISTLTDPFPTVALCADTSCNILVSNTADATARPWWALIGGFTGPLDSFFLLVVQISTTQTEWHYFGRPLLDDPSDPYGWLISVRNSVTVTSQSYSITALLNFTACQKLYWMRSADGTVKSTTSVVVPAYGSNTTNLGVLANTRAYPPPSGSKMRWTPIQVGCSGATGNTTTTPKNTPERGIIQNLFAGAHTSYSGVTNGDTALDSAYDPSATFKIFGSTFSASTLSNGVIVMQTGGTWHNQGFV